MFWDAVQHPMTLFPVAGGLLSAMWMGAFGISANGVKVALGCGLVAVGSWVYHYFIRGERNAERYAQRAMAEHQEQREAERMAFLQRFYDIGFSEGAAAAEELEQAYHQLLSFLEKQAAGGSAARFRTLAADCYREGQSLLQRAYQLMRALRSVDANALHREQALWQKRLAGLPANDPTAKTMQTRIESHQRRLDLYRQRQLAIQEFLTECDVLEAALESAYLEAIDLYAGDIPLGNESQSAASNLERAVSAARRVEDRLRGLEQGPDAADDDVYLNASDGRSPRQVPE